MAAIDHWDTHHDAGTVVTFAGQYHYVINGVSECPGWDCPNGDDCVAVLDLDSTEVPDAYLYGIHVGPELDIDTLGQAVA